MDTSRTLGWFTSKFPVIFQLTPAGVRDLASPKNGNADNTNKGKSIISEVIMHVKEKLHKIPNKGNYDKTILFPFCTIFLSKTTNEVCFKKSK